MTSKILHLIETSGPGGAESMLVNHIFALRRNGIDSDVLLLKDGWLHQRLTGLGIRCWLVPLHRSFAVDWLRQVRDLVRRENYTVLHAHEFSMNCHVAVLKKLCNVPAVATVHGKNYYAEKWRRRFLYRLAARTAGFVAVSDDIAQFLVDRIGISRRSITVVANGIDIVKHVSRPEVRTAVRSELGIEDDDILVGAVGNLYPVKGHIHLIHAAATVARKYPNAKFVVAGRGEEQDRLQAEINRLQLTKQFSLLGFRDDIDRLLQGFDIFAMPSLSEGLPISILEAMAAQRPVIASAVGGIPELIRNGENGLLVPAQNADELASALLTLIEDSPKRQAIASRAHSIVQERFSQDACTAAYLQLYRRLGAVL